MDKILCPCGDKVERHYGSWRLEEKEIKEGYNLHVCHNCGQEFYEKKKEPIFI